MMDVQSSSRAQFVGPASLAVLVMGLSGPWLIGKSVDGTETAFGKGRSLNVFEDGEPATVREESLGLMEGPGSRRGRQ